MEIIVTLAQYELHPLFISVLEYVKLYPHVSYIHIEETRETTQRICAFNGTTSDLNIQIDYFTPIARPPLLFLTSDGNLKIRIDFSKIQDRVSPRPFAFEESWSIGYIDPTINQYSEHIKKIKLMLKKSPWTYPLAIFCDSLRVRNMGGSGTTYHLVPSSLHEIVPVLEEQVLECFAPGKAPDLVNFSDDTTTTPAPGPNSISIQTLTDAFSKLAQHLDNVNQNLVQRQNQQPGTTPGRTNQHTDVDSDLEVEQFRDTVRQGREEDDQQRRLMSRLDRGDRHGSPASQQPVEGFTSMAQQLAFAQMYGEPNEPTQACLSRMFREFGNTGETRPECYRRLIRLGGLQSETPESRSGTSTNSSSSTVTSAAASTSSAAETPVTGPTPTTANTAVVSAIVHPTIHVPPVCSSTAPPLQNAITVTSSATNVRPISSTNQTPGPSSRAQSLPGGSRSTPTIRRPPFQGAEPFTTQHSAFQTASATGVRNPEDELATHSGASGSESRPSSSASALLRSEQDSIEVAVQDDGAGVPRYLNVPPEQYVEGLRGLLEDLDEFPATLVARNEQDQLLIMSRHLQVVW